MEQERATVIINNLIDMVAEECYLCTEDEIKEYMVDEIGVTEEEFLLIRESK